MTPGVTPETVDGMSLPKIDGLIDALRQERYWWTPVRRVYIAKKHSATKRPLGLPTWSDTLLQEVMRSILEAYDAGELLGFAGCMGHQIDVGGRAAGSFGGDATDIFNEGLRLPPVKLGTPSAREIGSKETNVSLAMGDLVRFDS